MAELIEATGIYALLEKDAISLEWTLGGDMAGGLAERFDSWRVQLGGRERTAGEDSGAEFVLVLYNRNSDPGGGLMGQETINSTDI